MKASAISVDISPDGQVPLGAATGADRATWLGISEPIEATFLAIWPDGEQPVLIVSLDLLYPGRILRAAIERAADLAPERIFVAATHTHRAPMTDDTKPRLGMPDSQYMQWLVAKVGDATRDVLDPARAVDVTMRVGTGFAEHSINRRLRKKVVVGRRFRVNEVVMAPNPSGETDETLGVIAFVADGGEPVGVIWNYACHPVGFPHLNTIAAHYPGVVRDALRAHVGNSELPVAFLQGFSGDTRPSASTKVHSARRRLRQLVMGRLFDDMTEHAYLEWAGSLAVRVKEVFDRAEDRMSDVVRARRVERVSADFVKGAKEPVVFHSVDLADVTLVGISGEAVSGYAARVRALVPSRIIFCVGCIDHPFGYVPTARILAEGGYEGGGFCGAFGLESLNASIESDVMAGFASVLSSYENQQA
ncbi:hypothetical protein OH146_04525 [Salinibacterium sp. SYSU T00001]|uniref:hypothetical protein n=1 Tax=Homoserinimonas sedimenticola TaxID=2986805 RepID=UPI0022363A8E|nr:hypothetical protein [Salinibacterium sedimenticola]MCW4385036.1 hypothetical protein [Salinibacterium sedimenticola]